MNAKEQRMDVELSGGPLDGFQTDVKVKSSQFDVSLFTWTVAGGVPKVLAYAFAGRTTEGGRRWVLNFLYEVARVGSTGVSEDGVSVKTVKKEEGGGK